MARKMAKPCLLDKAGFSVQIDKNTAFDAYCRGKKVIIIPDKLNSSVETKINYEQIYDDIIIPESVTFPFVISKKIVLTENYGSEFRFKKHMEKLLKLSKLFRCGTYLRYFVSDKDFDSITNHKN